MMNLALNIQLTDEQYAELMSKTHDKLFESEDFIKELSHIVLTQIGQYLKDHPSEIKKALGISENYYGMNEAQRTNRELMSKVIKGASEEYSEEISDAVKIALQNILKQTDLSSIIEAVLSKAILKGMSSGLTEYLGNRDMAFAEISGEVHNLKQHLGLN